MLLEGIYMGLIQATMIFIGLSLDSFVIMMKKGATVRKLQTKDLLLYALIYSVADVFAVLVGYLVSFIFKDVLSGELEISIACLIMFAIGVFLCVKSAKDCTFEEKLDKDFGYKQCFTMAAVTSLDTLFLGVGFSFLGLSMLRAVVLAFCVTFIAIVAAMKISYSQGARYQRVIGIVGGSLIIAFCLFILMKYVIMI